MFLITDVQALFLILVDHFMLVVGILIVLAEQVILSLVSWLFCTLQLLFDLLISQSIRDSLFCGLGSHVVGTLRSVSFVLEDDPLEGSVGFEMPHHV